MGKNGHFREHKHPLQDVTNTVQEPAPPTRASQRNTPLDLPAGFMPEPPASALRGVILEMLLHISDYCWRSSSYIMVPLRVQKELAVESY